MLLIDSRRNLQLGFTTNRTAIVDLALLQRAFN
jgi:hypothetical protein